MEPITTVTAALSIAKSAGEASNKLYDLLKSLKGREEKQQVDAVLEMLRDLKQDASKLEDENRELRERLRFKSDEYEFRGPFHYHRDKPDEPLCPKCFASQTVGHMSEQGLSCTSDSRRCLVCQSVVQVNHTRHASPVIRGDYPNPRRR